jgi:hypothetical protein
MNINDWRSSLDLATFSPKLCAAKGTMQLYNFSSLKAHKPEQFLGLRF